MVAQDRRTEITSTQTLERQRAVVGSAEGPVVTGAYQWADTMWMSAAQQMAGEWRPVATMEWAGEERGSPRVWHPRHGPGVT